MNKCPICGNRLTESTVLCPMCGAFVDTVRIADSALPHEENVSCAAPSMGEPALASSQRAMSRVQRKAELRAKSRGIEVYEVPESQPAEESKGFLEIEEIGESAESAVNAPIHDDVSDEALPDELPEEAQDDALYDESALTDITDEWLDDSPRRYHESDSEPQRQLMHKKRPVALILLAWLVVTAAIFTGFYFLNGHVVNAYGDYSAFVRELTNGKIELDTGLSLLSSTHVSVSPTQTEEGAPAHRFDVAAGGGESVRVLPLGESFLMENGRVTFVVTDEALASHLGVVSYDSTIQTDGVKLEIATTTQTFNYPVVALTLNLQDSRFTRVSPAQQVSTTGEPQLSIVYDVEPGATVYINNVNYSADVDDDGKLSITLTLETIGDNYFVVEIIQSGCRAVKDSFSVTLTQPPTSLAPVAGYLRVYETAFECTGTTDPGAAITASLGSNVYTGEVNTDGQFKIACKLDSVGLYPLQIKASKTDHADAEATVMIELLPEPDEFMAKAQKKTIRELKDNLVALSDVNIKTTATVKNLTSDADKQTFKLVSGDDAVSCFYYGTVRLSQDSKYTIYGKVDTATNSLYVMFVD